METILTFIHDLVMWIVTILVFIVIDLPLKIIAIIFMLFFGIIFAIFYPLLRKCCAPVWLGIIYDYTAQAKQLIASYVHKLWKL